MPRPTRACRARPSSSRAGRREPCSVIARSRRRSPVAAAPATVWFAVKKVYADLDIPVVVENPSARQIGNPNFFKMRQIGGRSMTEFVDCGTGMTGPKAATYKIYISLLTMVIPDGKGGTTVQTTFVPTGQDMTGASTDRIPCGTTGRFEQFFLDRIKANSRKVVTLAYLGAGRYPGPRTARPGFAPVCAPSRSTCTPFTQTWRTPTDSCFGCSNVARSAIVAGSNTTTSANIPGLQQSAIGDRQSRRDRRRHLSNRVLERNHALVAHVLAQDARIVAERARVHERARCCRGPAPPASVPIFIHGCCSCSFTLSSFIRKYVVSTRLCSVRMRSIAASR